MTTAERKGKLNIQISRDPFLLFVLTSILIHGVGLLMLVLSNRSLSATRQETESTPIEFVVVPPKELEEEPPPDTERRAVNNSIAKGKVEPKLPSATDKIGNEEAIATPIPPIEQKPVEPSSPPTKLPPIPKTKPPSPEQKTNVGSGSASLLGGTYRRTLSEDSGSSFFKPQANASQQALNPSALNARKDLNLGPYFAAIRRRVKRNWQPSSTGNNRHTVLVFSIQRNGQITGLQVRRSSGSEKVDREALAAVQKSSPFAALPTNFPNEILPVEFNFNIYIHRGVISPQLESWQRF